MLIAPFFVNSFVFLVKMSVLSGGSFLRPDFGFRVKAKFYKQNDAIFALWSWLSYPTIL